MSVIYHDDIDKVCRGCLGKKGEMRPLFGTCLDTMLMNVAEIQVNLKIGESITSDFFFNL